MVQRVKRRPNGLSHTTKCDDSKKYFLDLRLSARTLLSFLLSP